MASHRLALLSLTLLVATPVGAQVATQGPPAPEPAGAPVPGVRAQSPAETTPAAAPVEARTQEKPVARLGIGAGLGGTSLSTPTLYVPLDVGSLRLELEGAYAAGTASDTNATAIHVGLGAFRLVPTLPGIRTYFGGRLQYERLGVTGASSDGVRVAAVLGGEWFPAPAVSVGVEGQLGYSGGSANLPAGSAASRGVATSAQVILRIFLTSFSGGDWSASETPVAEKPAARPPLVKCQTRSDCSGLDFCYGGVCRH